MEVILHKNVCVERQVPLILQETEGGQNDVCTSFLFEYGNPSHNRAGEKVRVIAFDESVSCA